MDLWEGTHGRGHIYYSENFRTLQSIAVDLLEKFTRKEVITPDSEDGGVITPDFTSPVKVGKKYEKSVVLADFQVFFE